MPAVSNLEDLKADLATASQEDRFRWRMILFFTRITILAAGVVWYGFQRQTEIRTGGRTHIRKFRIDPHRMQLSL